MKKLLIAFGIVLNVFFAGSVMALNTDICEESVVAKNLKEICAKSVKAEREAVRWLSISEEKVDESTIFKKDGEIKDMELALEKENYNRGTKEYFKGYFRIKAATSKENGAIVYSDFQKEKMFIEAIDFLSNSEKIQRKPVILSGGILPGPSETEDGTNYMVNKFITKFVNGSLILLFSIGTLMMIIGGIMFLISSGDSEMLTKAKDTIFWGIVGIGISVMSYAIVKFIVGLDFGL